MKKNNQTIKCNVFECKFNNKNDSCCCLNEINVCECKPCNKKENTMCNSFKVKED